MFPHVYLSKPVSEETLAKKRKRGLCTSYQCSRPAAAGKTKCETCRSRIYRLRHPERYAWIALRESARKRRIGFELTFEEFMDFARRTGYLELKGRDPWSLTVDRINRFLPYRADNIRPMTLSDNCSHRYDVADEPADF